MGSKSLQEIVTKIKFKVIKVTTVPYDSSFTPNSEVVYGGGSPVYKSGFIPRTT